MSFVKGKPPLSITIIGFSEDLQLCVIETLDKYLEKVTTFSHLYEGLVCTKYYSHTLI